jgi:hypothetical protein
MIIDVLLPPLHMPHPPKSPFPNHLHKQPIINNHRCDNPKFLHVLFTDTTSSDFFVWLPPNGTATVADSTGFVEIAAGGEGG